MGTRKQTPKKRLSLALQGGGAHGAFTWGVLDALLADGRIVFEAVSGASAGAMNAIALADGLAAGGPDEARAQLERFWKKASIDGALGEPQRKVFDGLLSAWGPASAAGKFWLDMIARTASPYDFNPLDINPLKDILDAEIDFARIRAKSPVRLAISATNVETGKIKVFETGELTSSHILASAALPMIFKAVEIDGQHYWDGGYMGNPALYPLFYGTASDDVLLVQINPVTRKGVPKTPEAIQNRLNEITFNATLLRELRAVNFVTRLIDQGRLPAGEYKRVLMHRIAMSDSVPDETANTKLSAEWSFFLRLRDKGRAAAKTWLAAHFDDLGARSTMDLKAEIG